MNNDLKSSGMYLKKLRLSAGLSQADLAHLAQTSNTYISDLERGVRACGIVIAKRLAKHFNVKYTHFLP